MQITPHGDKFYLSSIGGGQALTSPKRHSLGRPLPYQLADTPQAAQEAINLYYAPRKTSVLTRHELRINARMPRIEF